MFLYILHTLEILLSITAHTYNYLSSPVKKIFFSYSTNLGNKEILIWFYMTISRELEALHSFLKHHFINEIS